MNQTAQYSNSPIRNCQTCVHCVKASYGLPGEFDKCMRWHRFCEFAVMNSHAGMPGCGEDLREWRAIPPPKPKRSLRQWFMDVFWELR